MEKNSLVEDIISLLRKATAPGSSWKSTRLAISRLPTIIHGYSSDDAYKLLEKESRLIDRIDSLDGNKWALTACQDGVLRNLLKHCRGRIPDIIENSDNINLLEIIIRDGEYSDIKTIDKVALKSTGHLQVMCASLCSVEVLKKIKGTGSKSLRKVVYGRLGPVECLDDMIDDKYSDIRMMGYEAAPFGYAKLSEKTNEIARGPTCILIRKIPRDYLPMLLANRNLKKNQWLANEMEIRMNSGF